jgi:hypothetical protein
MERGKHKKINSRDRINKQRNITQTNNKKEEHKEEIVVGYSQLEVRS